MNSRKTSVPNLTHKGGKNDRHPTSVLNSVTTSTAEYGLSGFLGDGPILPIDLLDLPDKSAVPIPPV